MKTYSYKLDAGIGLKRDLKTPRNSKYYQELGNLRVMEQGFSGVRPPVALSGTYSTTWPYPKLIETSLGIMSVSLDGLRLIAANGTATPFATFPTAAVWPTVVDVHKYFVVCTGNNANQLLVIDLSGSVVPLDIKYGPGFTHINYFKGRIIGTNPNPSWNTRDTAPGYPEPIDSQDWWFCWSDISDLDFRPFKKDTIIGVANLTDEVSNLAGWMPTDGRGALLATKNIGEHFILYGESEIGYGFIVDKPIPTIGYKSLLGFGIINKNAIAGDERYHYFIDATGDLWRLTETHKLVKLGYSEFLLPLCDANLTMSYNPAKKEVWICNHWCGYILTPNGLSGPIAVPRTSIAYDSANNRYIGAVPVDWTTRPYDKVSKETCQLDFGVRGIKNIEWIHENLTGADNIQHRTAYKFDGDIFTNGAWVNANEEDVSYSGYGGVDFKIGLLVNGFTDLSIGDNELSVQFPDRRYVRGTIANVGHKQETQTEEDENE